MFNRFLLLFLKWFIFFPIVLLVFLFFVFSSLIFKQPYLLEKYSFSRLMGLYSVILYFFNPKVDQPNFSGELCVIKGKVKNLTCKSAIKNLLSGSEYGAVAASMVGSFSTSAAMFSVGNRAKIPIQVFNCVVKGVNLTGYFEAIPFKENDKIEFVVEYSLDDPAVARVHAARDARKKILCLLPSQHQGKAAHDKENARISWGIAIVVFLLYFFMTHSMGEVYMSELFFVISASLGVALFSTLIIFSFLSLLAFLLKYYKSKFLEMGQYKKTTLFFGKNKVRVEGASFKFISNISIFSFWLAFSLSYIFDWVYFSEAFFHLLSSVGGAFLVGLGFFMLFAFVRYQVSSDGKKASKVFEALGYERFDYVDAGKNHLDILFNLEDVKDNLCLGYAWIYHYQDSDLDK